jgi:thiamine pyrophosphokinase
MTNDPARAEMRDPARAEVRLALVLAGGRLEATARVLERVRDASIVIAADGGARHADAIHRTIDLWVGDFDSSDAPLIARWANVPRQTHPTDKAQVDTELALQAARERGATHAVILGAFGGRFDHTLAIATIAVKNTLQGFPVALESGDEAAWVVTPQEPLRLNLAPDQTFSAISLEPTSVISVHGARWPLDRAELPFGSGLGVSNQALGPVHVELERGVVLVIVQYGAV